MKHDYWLICQACFLGPCLKFNEPQINTVGDCYMSNIVIKTVMVKVTHKNGLIFETTEHRNKRR